MNLREKSSPVTIRELATPFGPEGGELVFALVSPIGTQDRNIEATLKSLLSEYGFNVETIQVSNLVDVAIDGETEALRIQRLQEAGNSARKSLGYDILAARCIKEICARRETIQGPPVAYILRSLKHPSEVELLRMVYGHGLFVIASHASYDSRVETLRHKRLKDNEIEKILKTDESDGIPHGQNTRGTFELADFYVDSNENIWPQLRRFCELVFGNVFITPSRQEYGMNLAYAASLRSADLARQVGAVIMSEEGDILAAGCNEVHKAGGGAYWEGDAYDGRDYQIGHDPNDRHRHARLAELTQKIGEILKGQSEDSQIQEAIRKSGFWDLTEFGRSVHAEMDAITSCVRRGISTAGATLLSTTFPCHNCARHIVAAGIRLVFYIEPYPKSQAVDLYSDSIRCPSQPQGGGTGNPDRVIFRPFIGVAPRRYSDLFSVRKLTGSRIERKDEVGEVKLWYSNGQSKPRHPLSRHGYLDRETLVIQKIPE